LTDEQQKKYLEQGGIRCPYCNSVDITTTQPVQTDIGIAWQNICCNDCTEEWTDENTLTNVKPS